ncbi:CCA tRNA nucleotidyltransferase [Trichloromonas acetexigens]|uniref:CCA tRNA nucleotidyltransferase n=1 Tax=Trichloromonas acetexigens TaxID=38815 RepID=A0A550JL21_9BACT|nr:CCA tRNA nucleotidyltransferase [Desulfuromonas acetexigens]TRO83918.1 CCA tRNA nucleotidyltransferase [Desulfuromonas acetexigens]
MDNLHTQLVAARILPDLLDVLSGRPCWLVGGALRDALRGEASKDFDLATPGDPTPIAKAFAARIRGHWFLMDSLRHQSRVVVPAQAGGWAFDFAPLRAATLNEDLRLRDFTVNAVAWPVASSVTSAEFIDPLGGRGDIDSCLLRACSVGVFHDDPLRVLRGVRLAATLGMEIESETFALMGETAPELAQVAGERIQGELALIFGVKKAGKSLARLRDLGLPPLLFGPPEVQGSWEEGVRLTARIVAGLAQGAGELLAEFPEEEGEGGWSAAALLKLAALLAGYRPSSDVGMHLRLSRRAGNLLRRLRELPPETLDELRLLRDAAPRRRALWVEQLGAEPVLGLTWLLSQADDPRPWLPEARRALNDYHDHLRHGRIPDLVDGAWLRQKLGLSDGRRIGETLRKLRAAELSGQVKTPDEACKLLESLAEKNIDKEIDPP